ncbi:MAG: cysteine hydrolase [Hydrogenibacillus schlegelii]|uniref:Cysteine hydrolase n=1 Tax=Hydrogenibacillus schlegelii TaxID=1484 RepID=A0A947CV58_HYDSH|nr:cysteine hydrolase [Hydrogenibacillus schlegelii]MBT9281143.1 cysteine hydrolase [Hydrogenibacillus schlegelii]
MEALVVVDYLNDFAHPDGALTAGAPAQAIDGAILRAVRGFLAAGRPVIVVADAHAEDDPEFDLWPRHAVKGTWGAEAYGRTGEALRSELRGHSRLFRLEKTKYDAFYGTELERVLREAGVTDVYLAGINTSICVMATAQGAYFRGFRVHVLRDAVADLSPEAHRFALAHMAGIHKAALITVDEVLTALDPGRPGRPAAGEAATAGGAEA